MTSQAGESGLKGIGAREVLEALTEGAYITDRDRRILFWSSAAERITGWRADDVVGRRCADSILVHVDKDGHQLCGHSDCPLHRAIMTDGQEVQPMLVFARHKQGHRIPVEVSVAPLRDRAGRTVGGIEVFRDLSQAVEDLRRAKVIQDQILETTLPADGRVHFEVSYRPEGWVGGDFYRVEALGPDLYSVILADVMGHGLASALYTVQLRTIWTECRDELTAPVRFMGELNRRLHKLAGPDGYFATAVCLLLDVASGWLRYVRAAHPAPLWFRPGAPARPLQARSPAIGLFQDASYAEETLRLMPGDSLLLFTDGATEISNAQGEELGETGFRQLVEKLNGDSLDLARIEKGLLEFTHRLRLPDDLTLLSLQLR